MRLSASTAAFAIFLGSFSVAAVAQDAKSSSSKSPAALSQSVSPSNRDTAWRPTSSQVDLIQAQTLSYFAARDAGRLEEAYARFSPSQKATVPFETWRASVAAFNTKAGAVTTRLLRKVTWYKDAPQGPGVYAAVDFSSEFENLALHCGYVVWQEQPGGSFAIVREEDNVIEKTMVAKLKPGDLERIRAQFRC